MGKRYEVTLNVPVDLHAVKCNSCGEAFVILYLPGGLNNEEGEVTDDLRELGDTLYCPLCGKKTLVGSE